MIDCKRDIVLILKYEKESKRRYLRFDCFDNSHTERLFGHEARDSEL